MANDLTQIVTEKMQGLPIEEQQNCPQTYLIIVIKILPKIVFKVNLYL